MSHELSFTLTVAKQPVRAALLCPQLRRDLCVRWSGWIIVYLKWLKGERAVHCAVNLSLSQQKHFVLIERQVRQESFSAVSVSVNFSKCKVYQILKSCLTPGQRTWWKSERKALENMSEISVFTWSYVYIKKQCLQKTCVYCRVNWPRCK